jgi:hypothetical protein
MSSSDVDFKKFVRRVDRYAARLNPGLFAVALVLSSFLLCEVTVRLPALYQAELAANTIPLSIDPTALLTVDVPPADGRN